MNLVFASGFLVPQHVRAVGVNYFRGLDGQIRKAGRHNPVFPDVKALSSCEERAKEVAAEIQTKCPAGDIHIIAHSMGGLDSRFLIANNLDGLSARIKSLTTVATPHLGSPVADLLLGERTDDLGFGKAVAALLGFLSIETDALRDLRTQGVNIPDPQASHPDILYQSYAAVGRPGGLLSLLGLGKKTCVGLLPTYEYVQAVMGGENDGVVPFSSTRYGEFQDDDLWQCDHADAVGWNLDNPARPKFDHFAAYGRIIIKLEKRFTA
jgi:triacylglycerol lipase